MPRSKRSQPEIDASSMADIAFLLLVFWLSITTVLTVQGLPQKLDKDPEQQEVFEEQEQEINAQYLLVIQQKAAENSEDDCSTGSLSLQVLYNYTFDDNDNLEADLRRNSSSHNKNGKSLFNEEDKSSVGNKITWDYQPKELDSAQLNLIKEIVANHIRKQKAEHIIQFKYKEGICYQNYMTMFQTIESAYEEVRNEISIEEYQISWEDLKVRARKEPKTKEGENIPNGWREKEETIYRLVSNSKLSKQVVK